ncbi:phosphoenolpyruvate carboxykinase [Ilumatobacter sp.]|uniref:phosphoenolpyruvate carboxykinase n=1 Tax=Ilumatobacter sp. TaxID=1967498 RepID=UPI003B520B5A
MASFTLPEAASVAVDPTQDEMRRWAVEHMDDVSETEFGNLNYRARIKARQAPSTFFVTDEPNDKPTMSTSDAATWAKRQDEHIASQDMILIRGTIGPDPDFRTPCQLYMERTQANIPAMQQQLYFEPDLGADGDFEAEFTIVYTPSLRTPQFGNDCLILVDLDSYVTRVLGSDYFGESKMGGLRMWNRLVYDRGGLAMHSGAKTFPAEETRSGEEELALIIGLSGTGKTTTTFRDVKGSMPVQDDFIALMPDGTVHATENGCFAKTFGLDPDDEPTIHHGATQPGAWLESTHVADDGSVDFFDDSYTANGRVTFPLADIRHREPTDLPKAKYLFILNRNENIIPAVAKLRPEQAAYYFMLGETKGTSAGGASEAGRSLRVPGTNPFWFENDASQANRLLEILAQHPLEVYLLSTGRVGGGADVAGSMKVEIADSAAVQQGIVDGTIAWIEDPDFGYYVAESIDGVEDGKLRPRSLYESQGRTAEYEDIVATLKADRDRYLASFAGLDDRVARAG